MIASFPTTLLITKFLTITLDFPIILRPPPLITPEVPTPMIDVLFPIRLPLSMSEFCEITFLFTNGCLRREGDWPFEKHCFGGIALKKNNKPTEISDDREKSRPLLLSGMQQRQRPLL